MADDSAGFGVIFLQNTPRIWGDELGIFYDPVVLAARGNSQIFRQNM
jgi:hypothetical protein